MNKKFINLYVYSDSLAFRRPGQPHDLSFTYPFVLHDLIESRLGYKTNLLLRGRGGGLTIESVKGIIKQDSGYLGGDGEALTVAILQFGIVDCAPRPITYAIVPFLRRLPIVGHKIIAALVEHRRGLQNLWSYKVTPERKFKREYSSIVYLCNSAHMRTLSVGLPLPPFVIEHRSPGFRRSASIYNELIREVVPESFCDIEQHISESLRESLLLPDGHHLTEAGHQFYAEKIFEQLNKLL